MIVAVRNEYPVTEYLYDLLVAPFAEVIVSQYLHYRLIQIMSYIQAVPVAVATVDEGVYFAQFSGDDVICGYLAMTVR